MSATYVCDTSLFLCEGRPSIPMDRAITTLNVVSEVKSVVGRCALEVALSQGLKVERAKNELVAYARKSAERMGDLAALSDADITVIAKAMEVEGTVVTDDYDVQNVCAKLKISFLPAAQRGIEECREWVYVCPGCKRKFERGGSCPVCGTALRTKRL
ncbi:MAG: NOB1 family endonuclease [Methermicoccaceae archaeon]